MKSGTPCPNCTTPLRPSFARRYGMRAFESFGIVLGLIASVVNHGSNYVDSATPKDRYTNVKCRNCGEQFPITT